MFVLGGCLGSNSVGIIVCVVCVGFVCFCGVLLLLVTLLILSVGLVLLTYRFTCLLGVWYCVLCLVIVCFVGWFDLLRLGL